MKTDTLCLGDYQTNCYIARAENAPGCVVIDPGYQPERVLAWLQAAGRKLDAILLTHGHFDHVGGVEALVKATGCRVFMGQGDYSQRKNPMNDYIYPLHDRDFPVFDFCEEGETISAGGLTFVTMETPGHTWGSVCYLCKDALFSGDTLFAGSCGRIDLPGGDRAAMGQSLARLSEIQGDYRVFPGHGPATTLSEERRFNPYLKGIV